MEARIERREPLRGGRALLYLGQDEGPGDRPRFYAEERPGEGWTILFRFGQGDYIPGHSWGRFARPVEAVAALVAEPTLPGFAPSPYGRDALAREAARR